MMSKQTQLRLYGLLTALLVVVLMAGAYILGSLSNSPTLAAEPTATPVAPAEHTDAMQELTGQWEAMQAQWQHGHAMPMDQTMNQMMSMMAQMREVMASATPEDHAAMHDSMMEMMGGMISMAQEMMDQMSEMPAEERQVHMAQMMEMMQGMMGMMNMAESGSMSMQGMDMGSMMSMMGDMQGMMAQMQGMMEEMHESMPMGDMEAMMSQMGEMMSMMENMGGTMGGAMTGEGAGAESAPTQPQPPRPSAEELTQSAAAGAVTVKVTPLNIYESDADTLEFTVVLDTHSVDLDVDLAAMALLRTADREIAASTWDAPAGGHHVEGRLTFPAVDEAGDRLLDGAQEVTLVIQGLAGVPERAFTWELESVASQEPETPAAAGHGGMIAGVESGEDEAAGHLTHGGPIPSAGVPDATENVGSQPLAYTEEDGVKVFELAARPVRWTILEGDEPVVVTAWSYNGTVPGPMIRVTEGDQVRIVLKNELPETTSIHWHGIPVPHAMDGVPPVTQAAIEPGESFTYEFTAPPAGSFMYHSHVETDRQIMLGLYAPFIVDPAEPEADAPAVDVMWMLSEWRVGPDGETYPAMPMAGGEPNYFTINGKAYPDVEPIVVKQGETVRIRMAGIGQFVHPMHLHGMNFRIVAYDGVSLRPEQQITRNTVPVNPGEVIDIEFTAEAVGTWIFHCHVLHHVTNDGIEPGGLIGVIEVVE
jgi:manganese oxidase